MIEYIGSVFVNKNTKGDDMDQFLDVVTNVNDTVNTIVWTKVGVWLLIAVGVIMTFLTGFCSGDAYRSLVQKDHRKSV